MAAAEAGFPAWAATPGEQRAKALERAAELLEHHRGELLALLQNEGGKTLDDALSEVREAIDYCRYYAAQARGRLAVQTAARPHRRKQCAALSRARRVCLHQSVEFSARDLSRPGRSCACGRQCGGGEARRADPAHCRARGGAFASSRRTGDRASSAARRRQSRRKPRRRCVYCRRLLHGLDRGRACDQSRARRQERTDRAADRRNRRHQCHDRRRHRFARASDRRRHHIGLPFGRPALFGVAASLPAGRYRRADARDARRRHARTENRRSAPSLDPCRAGDRRRGQAKTRGLDRRYGERRPASLPAASRPQSCRQAAHMSCRR